jgi:hypothetical protein
MRIPDAIDYRTFLREFLDELKLYGGVSFFTYGSHLRDDFVAGVSDIDGFLMLDKSFITDKDLIGELATSLSSSLKRSNWKIKTQFNVLDRGIAKDGRFLAYSKNYVDFFKKNAVRVYGDYNLEEMNGFDYKNAELTSIAHNLHKVRQGFLYNDAHNYFKKKDFYESDLKSPLKKLAQLPKQLLNLSKGVLYQEKDNSLEEFLKEFPEYEGSFVRDVNRIMKDSVKYERFLDEEESIYFSKECLTEMEKMIKVYVEKFPKPRENEVKDGLSQ